MVMLDLQEAIDLIDGGRAEEALPRLKTWAGQLPMHAAVHVVLARAYEATEQWDDAQAAWNDVHVLMPNSPAAAEGLARVRQATAQPVAAGADRLVMDLDLQAELEATLEALFNPFTLPQQSDADADEADAEDPSLPEDVAALAQVQAALAAAAADEEDADDEPEAATAIEAAQPEPPEAVAEAEETDEPHAPEPGAMSIYDEVEQLIEEKESREQQVLVDDAAADATETAPAVEDTDADEQGAEDETAPVDDIEEFVDELIEQQALDDDEPDAATEADARAADEDLEALLEEEKRAVEALEAMVQDAAEQDETEAAADTALGLDDWQEFAEEEATAPAADADIDDLERLISELESARIVPQPELDDMPAPDLDDDIEDMVSETLARIYASQEQFHEAARVYEQLALQHPEDADRLNQLAAEMNTRARGGTGE